MSSQVCLAVILLHFVAFILEIQKELFMVDSVEIHFELQLMRALRTQVVSECLFGWLRLAELEK